MTRLRKEKERELFQQFQSQQDKMADLLQSQRLAERNTEDEIVARAMQEQYTKKEVWSCTLACGHVNEFLQKAEEEKQRLLMERTQDIQQHRIQMMAEKERKEKEEKDLDREMLYQRQTHDLQV